MHHARRILVVVPRLLVEAWRREVSRVLELKQAPREARVRQPLGEVLGHPALRALEAKLASEDSGWWPVGDGYQYDVEGGYVIYLRDEMAIEIVAMLEEDSRVIVQANDKLEAQVRNMSTAENKGLENADGGQDGCSRINEQHARENVEHGLDQETVRCQTDQSEWVQRHLERVGLRCQQALYQLLASAYRDAILAYAKQRGAEKIHCDDLDETIDIEFTFTG